MPSQDLFTALNDVDNMYEESAEVQYNFYVEIYFKSLSFVRKSYNFFKKNSNRYYIQFRILNSLF